MGHDESPRDDPWLAFGYLVAGVLFYGGIGFGLDRWLGTRFLVVIGVLLGAGLGVYMTHLRFGSGRTEDKTSEVIDEQHDQ